MEGEIKFFLSIQPCSILPQHKPPLGPTSFNLNKYFETINKYKKQCLDATILE